ncbi:MAG: hypothetical protein HYU60_07875 [Magnetospirillum sp.]|nr:hypothetical protein [Magnetospirillum sp.]
MIGIRRPSTWMVISLAAAGLLVLLRPGWLAADLAAAATLPMLAAAAAWVIYARENHPPLPFIPVAVTFYGICYGLPVFLAGLHHSKWGAPFRFYDLEITQPGQLLTLKTQLLVGAGAWLFLAGATLVNKISAPAYRLPTCRGPALVQAALWGLAALHFAWLLDPHLRALPSIGQFLGPAGLFALGGIYTEVRRGQAGRMSSAALVAALVLEMVVRVASGAVTQPLMIFLFGFLLLTRLNGRMPAKLAAAGMVVAMLTYPAIHEIRQRLNAEPATNVLVNLAAVTRGIADHYTGNSHVAEDMGAALSQRVGLIFLLSHVVNSTPDPVPYWGGETYYPLVTSWVPRAIWRNKPEERLGWDFRERYHLIAQADNPTTVNLPWMVELFANFGALGIIVGMTAIGILLGLLDRVFNRTETDGVSACAGLVIILPLVYQESNFSLVVGSLPQLALALWLWFGAGVALERTIGWMPRRP